ncbi:MAG TPA: tRNA (adenosine(37)-N6)-threonylcarbamoyltransferase complex ATPase subunit type 1 TsaE, partial [Burkholderiaceae bacterium]|nr:tRNA (adenosine(37)-N6)-threonylcarbamoyltransferase complex ATPase subunit type 1 TsaE [Burkholderiaceae bacterium]
FALLEPYTVSSLDFYHFDFYRLKEPDEFGEMGFRELFGPGRICAVEWPERAGRQLPTADISIALTIEGEGRLATISAASELGDTCLKQAMMRFQLSAGDSSPPAPARSSSR